MANDNRFGFVRVATACPKVKVADPSYNRVQHLELLGEASESNVDILVYPELSITGYTCGDLFQQQTLLAGAFHALWHIKNVSMAEGCPGLIFVGLPLAVSGRLMKPPRRKQRGIKTI